MTTSLWPYAITDEWKAAGVNFHDFFKNATMSARNGLKTVGSPAVSDGLRLDGSTQYGYYDLPHFHAATGFTIELEFVPSFEFGDSTEHYLFDGTPNLELSVIKLAANTLELRIKGTQIFASAAFAAYWLTNQENKLIISSTSGDTTVYLNGTKVIDSNATAFGKFAITKFTLGAKQDGTSKTPGIIKSFRYFMKAFTDADCEKLYDGRLLSELDPEKAALYCGLNSTYTNGASEDVTPIIINGETQEGLLGSDGKTPAEKPTIISPRGFRFDGGDFITIQKTNELNYSDDLQPFSVCWYGIPKALNCGLITKITSGIAGLDWALYVSSGNVVRFYKGADTGYFFATSSVGNITRYPNTWIGTWDSTLSASGIKLYRNGKLDSSGSSAAQAMTNRIANIEIGRYLSTYLQGITWLAQVISAELSPAQARMWHARARRLKNV